jgi:hypothetical protein
VNSSDSTPVPSLRRIGMPLTVAGMLTGCPGPRTTSGSESTRGSGPATVEGGDGVAAGRAVVVAVEEAAEGVDDAVGGAAQRQGVGIGRQRAAGPDEAEALEVVVEDERAGDGAGRRADERDVGRALAAGLGGVEVEGGGVERAVEADRGAAGIGGNGGDGEAVDDLGGGVGGRRRGFGVADVVLGDAVEGVAVAGLTGEGGGGGGDVVLPEDIAAAVGGDVDVVAGDAGAAGVVGAGPLDEEVGTRARRRQRLHGAGRGAGVDGVEGFLGRVGAFGRVVRVDLVGGDRRLSVERRSGRCCGSRCRWRGRVSGR